MINKLLSPILERLPENNKLERIWLLSKNDFKKRYYGTSLGIIWALINPFSQLLIYYYIFAVLFKTDIPNYSLYLFSGLIIWMFFSESTTKGLSTFMTNRGILENVRINKHNIVSAGMISTLFSLTFNFFVFFVIALFFDLPNNRNLLYLPVILFNMVILVYGLNLILSIVFMYLRDFQHFWDIFVMALFWLNPIVYSETIIYENKILLILNPIAGMIVNAHNAIIYGKSMDFKLMAWDFAYSIVVLVIGLIVFKYHSKKVTEIL